MIALEVAKNLVSILEEKEDEVSKTEFNKIVSDLWKAASTSGKKGKKEKKAKKEDGEGKPTRPPTAYNLFMR